VSTVLLNKALDFIKKPHERPFFLYYATTNIHHPFTPSPRFIHSSEAGRYGDFIQELDWLVGEIVRTLDEMDLAENTLLIFTSDNGGMLNQGGQNAWQLGHHQNGDLLGFKFDAWEGGHRVPCIIRWPGHVPAGSVSDELLCNVDFLATMAALTGYTLKAGEGPDSFNALPAITGTTKKAVHDFIIIHPFKESNLAVRKGKWMYISGQGGGGFGGKNIGDHDLGGAAATRLTHEENSDIENAEIRAGAPPAQLYDLEADPEEKNNLYNSYPKIVAEMQTLLKKAMTDQTQTRK